jgi:hypothetical protein
MKKDMLLRAALAGLSVGVAAPAATVAEEPADVKCYGINGCGQHASCAVKAADLQAVRALLGSKEYAKRFGKSEAHSCGAHAKCGAGSQVLNWVSASAAECKAQGGLLIEEKGGKKVAKKA